MTRTTIAGGALATALVVLALATVYWVVGPDDDPALAITRFLHWTFDGDADPAPNSTAGEFSSAGTSSPAVTPSAAGGHPGLLYGRITTEDGAVHEGRLRWGDNEEAVWGNYFNGFKDENPWATHVPEALLPKERRSIGAFGFEIAGWNRTIDLGRPFMVRFGDIALIEPRGRDIRVTLKSGAMVELDRFSADDLADSVRVWDETGGSVSIGEWRIRAIEFLPYPGSGAGPQPLHGTVRTRQEVFTGLIQWDREDCLVTDELIGRTADGEVRLRFHDIRSIAPHAPDASLVTLRDGREIVLTSNRQAAGQGNRGMYVDDPRYGRVLISWEAFERVDFTAGGTGPAYDDFPVGRPITGTVATRSGRRFSGALAFDLDESVTVETLDAPWQGVDYTIPFGLVASIVLPDLEGRGARHASVTLHSGEALQLELTGDLGEGNLGMLIFVNDDRRPEYVRWADIERIDFDGPQEMYPPHGSR